MVDPRFEPTFRERLGNHDYHAIFSYGCCYHFALKLYELYDHKLAFFPSDSSENGTGIGHCWARRGNGKAIDINGVLDEETLIKINNGGYLTCAKEIPPDELRKELEKKQIPEQLNSEIYDLAERIIKNHERFRGTESLSNTLKNIFESSELSTSPNDWE